jgi:hypothetical protein
VIPEDYREMLVAIATAASALTGLLFVALSVAPRRERELGPRIIRQIRAAAALLAFSNALSVSLFGLVPGTNVGYPSVALGVIGIAFTAAAMRSIVTSPATAGQKRSQLGLISLLLLIFGTELIAGVVAIIRPVDKPPVAIGYALVASLVLGISRAWELVGDIDTSLMASITALTGRGPQVPPDGPPVIDDLPLTDDLVVTDEQAVSPGSEDQSVSPS